MLKDGIYQYFKIDTDSDNETPAGGFELLNGSIVRIEGGVAKTNLELGPLTKEEEHTIKSINRNGYGAFRLIDQPDMMAKGGKVGVLKSSPHHFLFTSENPMHPIGLKKQPTIEEVLAHLNKHGEQAQLVKGKYGNEENSIIVHNPKDIEGLKKLAMLLGQDSSILSKDGEHTAFFHHGDKAGMVATGKGTTVHKEKPADFYTEIQTEEGPQYFTHNIDWTPKKHGMADGGRVMYAEGTPDGGAQPEGFIPDSEFTPVQPEGFVPDAEFVSQEEKYGTPGQIAKTALEGAAAGAVGSTIATGLETGLGIATPEDIAGRKQENPWVHGGAQAAGLIGTGAMGVGAGRVLGAVGESAAALTGLGEGTSLMARVGSSVAANAAEMAVMQGDDEIAKMILKNPDTSVSTAILNTGLAAVLGGTGGAIMTGAVSPLWKATGKDATDKFLNAVKSHLNGTEALELPEAVLKAKEELGIPIDKVMNSALSGNPLATKHFNILRELEHPEIMRQLNDLSENSHKAILDSLNTNIDDIAVRSKEKAGQRLEESFNKEATNKYDPIGAGYDQQKAIDDAISIPDNKNLSMYEKLVTHFMDNKNLGTDSPYYKKFFGSSDSYAERLLNRGTIGEQSAVVSDALAEARASRIPSEKKALNDFARMVNETHDSIIASQARELERLGVEHGIAVGAEHIQQRAANRAAYREYAQMMQQMSDYLSMGRFSGHEGFKKALSELPNETLVKKFSPKGDVGAIPFLQKYFPETAREIQMNETANILKSSIYEDKGVNKLNIGKLSKSINNLMKDSPELVNFALPESTLNKIKAAQILQDAIPDYSSSKSAHWMSKLLSNLPASVMAMIGAIGSRSVGGGLAGGVGGYAIGELMNRLGRDVPDAARLSLLAFLSADKPVNSTALHASVDMIHNIIKGEALLNKSVDSVFRTSLKGVPDFKPDAKSIAKLDKLIAQKQDNPSEQLQTAANSDLGHYHPNHQAALTQTTTTAVQYLQSIKPKSFQASPLDKKIPPSQAEMARYTRALEIAQAPEFVMQHIKEGTLQNTDIQDLNSMYPALYKQMTQKLTNAMISHTANDGTIPYKTRVSISLFLGQPLDSSMTPASIQAAQPQPQMPPQQSGQPKGKPAQLKGKSVEKYQTPGQSAEADRSKRK